MKRPKQVTLVDYGLGNLFSVAQALKFCGAEVSLASTPEGVKAADFLVLPGVGAFGAGMDALREKGLDQAVCEAARSGKPLLGICLGMQLMFAKGHEFGEHSGLGLVPGKVVPIPTKGKVPHVGWDDLLPTQNGAKWAGSPLEGLQKGMAVYFVHSFHGVPDRPQDCLAVCQYDGQPLTAVIRHDQILGCQFHPEKSGKVGLSILKRWLEE